MIEACGGRLDEASSKDLLKLYGISCPPSRLCSSLDQACAAAEAIGYPLVAKGVTPDILHKTEAGLVHLNIRDAASLKKAWADIENKIKASGRGRFQGGPDRENGAFAPSGGHRGGRLRCAFP
jgi:acyl-CoA synthetase (NDP forming)